MASVEIASNSSALAGKWLPYYWKPFKLGRVDDGQNSSDGSTYITMTSGSSGPINNGICTSSHNCGFYYIIEIETTISDAFSVKKYDSNDTLVDTIVATSPNNDWDIANTGIITIDIGVYVNFSSMTSGTDGDKYKITLPSADVMDRRKIYHGGYSTFLRMPETEGVSNHSDIIPCDLKGKNITVSFNPNTSSGALTVAKSSEDALGNLAVSMFLEWNVNPHGQNSNVAVGTYGWHADETWSLGSMSAYDVDPSADFPAHASLPASDVTPIVAGTGTVQSGNTTVSGRAGHAKIRLEYEPGTGSPAILAKNQFWPIILTIS